MYTQQCLIVIIYMHLCQQVFCKHTDSSHSTVLTKRIEAAALGHKMWQFIDCFLQSYMLLIFLFTLVNLTISFYTLLEAL